MRYNIQPKLVLTCDVPGCGSIFSCASLVSITIGILTSAKGLKICTTAVEIKKYKSIIKKKRKNNTIQ